MINQHLPDWRFACIRWPRQVTTMNRSTLISGLLHAATILAILTATGVRPPTHIRMPVVLVQPPDPAPIALRHQTTAGGGGMRDPRPASQGDLARRATHVFVAPTPYTRDDPPRIAIEPALLGEPAPRTFDFAQLGIPTAVPGPPSGGPGRNGGIGAGDKGGAGDGQGPLPGAENGGLDAAGKLARLTAPVLLYKAEPEYSDEARKAKLQGSVQLLIEIDEHGTPRNIGIRQGLGLGLDEKAIESVKRWRFRPATRNGHPIPSNALIEVFFRLL